MTSIWDLWRSWDLVGLKICRSSVIQSDLHMSSKTRLPFPSLNPVPYLILLKTRLPFPSLNPVPYLILLEQPRKTSIVSAIERVTSLRQRQKPLRAIFLQQVLLHDPWHSPETAGAGVKRLDGERTGSFCPARAISCNASQGIDTGRSACVP